MKIIRKKFSETKLVQKLKNWESRLNEIKRQDSLVPKSNIKSREREKTGIRNKRKR
jgi:hypothetical protein